MNARTVARLYAGGRLGLGAALVAAPRVVGRPWIGRAADEPGGLIALRGLGIRDAVMGAVALHVADHPQVGARWMAMCAAADAVDLGATLAAGDRIPATGRYGVAAVAASGAAMGVWLWTALRS